MDSLQSTACFNDDLLDFPSDISDIDNDDNNNQYDAVFSTLHCRRRPFTLLPCPSSAFPELVEEEELEWISNKDAFPMVESFVDIIPNHPNISSTTTVNNNGSHLSPVSVLENSCTSSSINSFPFSSKKRKENAGISAMISLTGIFKVPGKARSARSRKPTRLGQFRWWEMAKPTSAVVSVSKPIIGRKCLHCGSEKTPQWRAGPLGPKTLCNACGVRYKSGRLVPEYRPASSPTFSSELHSNSHRKIVEMRKSKMVVTGLGDSESRAVNFS
ncbi:hypothetical protein KSS87_012561 [Heliosperma pusillum]|nr:hypothetical protein KSS87_012561 [Heliosperma pusillum]